jgi:YceI-like protein
MKMRNAGFAAVLAGAVTLLALGAHAVTAPAIESSSGIHLGGGSSLWIEGKSNLHEFESRTSTVAVNLKRESGAAKPATVAELEAVVRGPVTALDVDVPVTSLHSGKAGLDKNLWQDLRADANPTIHFHLTKYAAGAPGDTTNITAEGTLRIAGRERPVTLHARAYRAAAGWWIDGNHELQMTDFGIKPRTMMLGTLRVKDEVVVHYHLLLIPEKV